MADVEFQSDNSQSYKVKVIRLFNGAFRAFLSEKYQQQLPMWDNVSEEILCNKEIYNKFARFLAEHYRIPDGVRNAGDHLSPKSALGYFGALVVKAKSRFEHNGSPATQLFFTCLDQPNGQTLSAKWYRTTRKWMFAIGFKRIAESGQPFHQSAEPIYPNHVGMMMKAYSRAGDAEV